METLDIHINGQETLLDKKKLVKVASLIVNSSRGIWAGTEKDRLYEYAQREFEFYDNPVNDATGVVEINLDAQWSKNGRVYVRQSDPNSRCNTALRCGGLLIWQRVLFKSYQQH